MPPATNEQSIQDMLETSNCTPVNAHIIITAPIVFDIIAMCDGIILKQNMHYLPKQMLC